jgi:hypothetical protein
MPAMARYDYEPIQAGWIVLRDMWGVRVAVVNCLKGGAQEQFEDLCRELQRSGWELGKRYFDNCHLRRGGVRWEISIGRYDPYDERPMRGWYPQMKGSK